MTKLIQFANNAVSNLVSGISDSDTTLTVTPGGGSKFPSLSGSRFFMATLIKATGEMEIVKVTNRVTDTFTIVRAAEPVAGASTAYSFSSADRIELRITAGGLSNELSRLDAAAFITAQNKSANYTVTEADISSAIRVATTGGARTITLPLISSLVDDFDVIISKVTSDTNKLTIAATGPNTINGSGIYEIINQWHGAWLIADRSTNVWTVIASGSGGVVSRTDTFTGSGTTGPFTLSGEPGTKNNTAVFVGGVYQNKSTYTLVGDEITLGAVVGTGISVEVNWSQPVQIGQTTADLVEYTPAGTGAVATTVEDQLNEIVTRSGYNSDTNFNNAAVGKVAINSANTLLAPRFEGNALDDAGTPDAIFRVSRDHVANTSPHSFRDQTIFRPPNNGLAMASFDSAITSSGAANHDHTIGFQARPTHSGTGTLADLQGYGWYPTVDGPVTNTWGVEIRTPTGAGTITNEYGIRIRNLTRGTNKHPIYIDNNTGTNIIGAATQFNNSGIVSIGGNARLFLGDPANGYKSVAYNHNQSTNTYHITDVIQSMYYGPQDITFRSAPSGAAGATPTFTNILNVRTDQASGNFAAVFPAVDNVSNLGVSGLRWKEIFCANGVINTSDARMKTEVRVFNAAEIEAAKALSKEIGIFQFLDAVEKKGDKARLHVGMTVQRAIEIMQSHGLDPFAYSFICYDKWENEFVDHPAIYEQVIVEEAEYETIPAWDEPVTETLVIDGKEAQISRTIHRPKQVKLIKDSVIGDGPVLQEAWKEQTRVAGDSYGFRMDQILAFIARGFEARLTQLEENK